MRVLVLAQCFPLNMMRQALFANWDFWEFGCCRFTLLNIG